MRLRLLLHLAVLLGLPLLAAPGCAPRSAGTPGAARVLIVGGGTHHDFTQWFHKADSATLATVGAEVRYVEETDRVLPRLAEVDVLYLSNNQPLADPALRAGIFDFVRGGKGLIIGHAAGWYNWPDWPEYNRELVGGGTRAHRNYGSFRVDVVAPGHPVMQGVPASFTIDDELYRFQPDAEGAAIAVLARAREEETGVVYPVVWTVRNPGGRIVVNTLGHDGAAHTHPAYQRILQNAVRWVAG